ncbi:MAG: hypothetical protein H0U04_09695 [Rubrobacter sp.]|nr:hypothetical protein [Rubrobacter sp.]
MSGVFRNPVAKVMWVERATVFLVGLSVILAVLFGVASAALAGNGDAWRLGQINVATNITRLGGEAGVNGPMLRLINNDAGTDDTALELRVQAGEAPMQVNSATRVDGLNADQLDGRDSSQFVANSTYRLGQGQERAGELRDNNTTSVLEQRCLPGDRLFSGGPASVNPNSDVLDSHASDTLTWTARIALNGQADNFTVVVLCADQ